MEEIQSQSDHYRSSSLSASSPASRVPSSNFFYLRKPGSLMQPISFEDSPEWDDTDIDVRVEEGGDSINVASTLASPSLSKLNSRSLQSPYLPEGAVIPRKIAGASVAWKDLTVTIKGKRKYSDKVIKSSTGYALPGTVTVIMGPAKSEKSTLLQAIAGRLHPSTRMYGEVFVNGAKSQMPYGSYVYVERETTLIGSLTVREFLYYSALLQLPGFFCQKKSVVEDAIHAMSLGDHANKLIGGHCYMKGLPSGERRLVSIARELVMRPRILFIDEPLYHLNSVSALLMMVTLKRLASTGYTLILTIYQSSTEVFGLFYHICLLSNGNTLFFGETLACLQDDNGDFSSVNMDTAVAIRTLEATYKSSADAAAVETMILKLAEKVYILSKKVQFSKAKVKLANSNANWIAVLIWRSLLVVSREWKYCWLHLILYMLLTLCIGTVFSGLGHSLSSVVTRVAAIFVFASFSSLLSIARVPALKKEIKVRFIIGVDGPKHVRLEEMREKHSLQDRVEMLGAVQHVQMIEFLSLSDVGVLNISNTILEAASCGLLTVSTRVGGVPEVLPDEMIVLAEPDPGDMVHAIQKAISMLPKIDPQAMHNRMRELYNWHDVAKRTEIVYDRAFKCSNQNLLERLSRYLFCGAWAGKLFFLVMIVGFLLWQLLELWQPADDIEEVPDFTLPCSCDEEMLEKNSVK
ncbi:ABC transporter G family member 3 [Glycine max]|nr:ABC transporter G family member 3 [Glycine max]